MTFFLYYFTLMFSLYFLCCSTSFSDVNLVRRQVFLIIVVLFHYKVLSHTPICVFFNPITLTQKYQFCAHILCPRPYLVQATCMPCFRFSLDLHGCQLPLPSTLCSLRSCQDLPLGRRSLLAALVYTNFAPSGWYHPCPSPSWRTFDLQFKHVTAMPAYAVLHC